MTASHLNPIQGSGKTLAELLNDDTAAAHIYPSTLKTFERGEHFDECFSIKVGNEDETSVGVFTIEQVRAAFAIVAAQAWEPIETVPATTDDVLLLTQSKTVRIETGHYARNMLAACKVDGDDCHFVRWMPVPSTSVLLANAPAAPIASGASMRCRKCGESVTIEFNVARSEPTQCCRKFPCEHRPGQGPCDRPAMTSEGSAS